MRAQARILHWRNRFSLKKNQLDACIGLRKILHYIYTPTTYVVIAPDAAFIYANSTPTKKV